MDKGFINRLKTQQTAATIESGGERFGQADRTSAAGRNAAANVLTAKGVSRLAG